MQLKNISSTGKASKRPGSYEFSAANVSANSVGKDLDPLIAIDHFVIRAPVFAPHPHAGFSAVTCLFEDSEGVFVNRDSLGNHIEATPGSVIWSVTGSGLLHDEFPKERGMTFHGLQVFMNLASTEKMNAPRVLFVDGTDVPVVSHNGVRVRVIAGNVGDVNGKIQPPGNTTFLDIWLEQGSTFEESTFSDQSVLAYIIEGSIFVSGNDQKYTKYDAIAFEIDGDTVSFKAVAENTHVVVIAGAPLDEKVVSYGPFVMNSEEEIRKAIIRYKDGKMGQLESINL